MKLKHDLMYELYGTDTAHICKECCNLWRCITPPGRRWHKCAVYGVSRSSSTDWNIKKAACGRFNIPLKDNERPVIELKRHSKKDKEQIQCEGQICMIGFSDGMTIHIGEETASILMDPAASVVFTDMEHKEGGQ